MTNDAKGTVTAPRKRAPAKTATTRPRKTTAPASLPPAGWYPDPAAPGTQRFWDGEGWMGAAVPADLNMTGRTPGSADPEPTPAPAATAGRVTFRGRSMRVHDLSVEQIGVWRRIARQFETATEPLPNNATDDMKAARSKNLQRMLDRCLDVVMSVLVDESDQEWIETQLLTHQLKLSETITLITLVIEAFTASRTGDQAPPADNRAGRRAQAKARRRD